MRHWLLVALPVSMLLGSAYAQKLEVTPATVLADQPADIRATGFEPGATVTLVADLTDGGDQPWHSEAEFTADALGEVDTAKQAPVKGSYRIVSAMGLVWSMSPAGKGVHQYEAPKQLGPQTIHFRLVAEGKEVSSADLVQLAVADGVQRIRLEGNLHGILFEPAGEGKRPGVLVLGGSEGGAPTRKAAWLASHGYAALALAYFRFEGLPDQLRNIPLEYFGQALAWMAQRPEIDGNRMAVTGTSRGGELSLQLGAIYPVIRAVVAYVPANVRVQACCGRGLGAAWTWNGEPLAWSLPQRRADAAEVMNATIRVEKTHGPILMIAGDDDGVWPSAEMVDAAAGRLHSTHFEYPVVVLKYPHAGHRAGFPEIIPAWSHGAMHPVSGCPVDYGGTPEGNAESSLDATQKVLEFLRQSLGGAAPAVTGEQKSGAAQP